MPIDVLYLNVAWRGERLDSSLYVEDYGKDTSNCIDNHIIGVPASSQGLTAVLCQLDEDNVWLSTLANFFSAILQERTKPQLLCAFSENRLGKKLVTGKPEVFKERTAQLTVLRTIGLSEDDVADLGIEHAETLFAERSLYALYSRLWIEAEQLRQQIFTKKSSKLASSS